jgi:putative transposase
MSEREKENQSLTKELKILHQQSEGTYGAPRLAVQLQVGKNRVAKLMREIGLFGCARRKYRLPETTNSKHRFPVAPRIFKIEDKKCLPQAPNQLWVSDTTYIPTGEGWLYLTIQLDVFTRKVVGYTLADNLRSEAVWDSMKAALVAQPDALSLKASDLLAHSDRGSQYASPFYQQKLSQLGIMQSMSRTGNCYDNAYAESFFHTLKVELIHRNRFKTRKDAEQAIRAYIDGWYNLKRLHSGLGYKAPIEYEREALVA